MGICRRIPFNGFVDVANYLRILAGNRMKDAIAAKVNSGLTRKDSRKYTKLISGGSNTASLRFGEIELVASSSVNQNDSIYNDFFVTNVPSKKDVLHVTSNRDINWLETGWTRETDSEAKLLHALSQTYSQNLISGTIEMYTYRQPCLSCDYYIVQFMKKYINVNINIYYEINYPDGEIENQV